MPRIARLIIYEGSDIQLAEQLGRSMPEGSHNKGKVKINIIKLSEEPILNAFIQEQSNKWKDEIIKHLTRMFILSAEEIEELKEQKDFYQYIASKKGMTRKEVKQYYYNRLYKVDLES